VFKGVGLKEVKVFAYNPANAIVRFFFFNKSIKKCAGNIIVFFEKSLDILTSNNFSRRFGYMTFAVGKKQ